MRPWGIVVLSIGCSGGVAAGVAYWIAGGGPAPSRGGAQGMSRSELGGLRAELAALRAQFRSWRSWRSMGGMATGAPAARPAAAGGPRRATATALAQGSSNLSGGAGADREPMPRTQVELRAFVRQVVDTWHRKPSAPRLPRKKPRRTLDQLAEELDLSATQLEKLRSLHETQNNKIHQLVFGTQDRERIKRLAETARRDPAKAGTVLQGFVSNIGHVMALLGALRRQEASILEPAQLQGYRRYEIAGADAELDRLLEGLFGSMGIPVDSAGAPAGGSPDSLR